MTVKCVVCGERQERKTLYSFHRFPKDEVLRQKWIRACKLEESAFKCDARICSKHFTIEDYDDTFWPKKKLFPSAVSAPSKNYLCTENALSQSLKNECPILQAVPCGIINNIVTTDRSPSNVNIQNLGFGASHFIPDQTVSIPSTSSDKTIPASSGNTTPSYCGDLKVEHFSSPRKAKRNLDFVKEVVSTQRKKINVLQVQKQRLEKRIDFKDLLHHLSASKMITEEAFGEMMHFWTSGKH